MRNVKLNLTFFIGFILLILAGLVTIATGWWLNIIHLVQHHAVLDADLLIRLVGVPVFILGAILGWLS